MSLSRDEILSHATLATEEVEVPEFGGVIRVRELTGAERDRLTGLLTAKQGQDRFVDLSAQVVVWGAIDEEGKPLFTQDDVARLTAMSGNVVSRLRERIQDLSGMSAKEVAALEKKSETTPAPASASD